MAKRFGKTTRRFLKRTLSSILNVSRTCFTNLFGLLISYMLIQHRSVLLDTYVYCMAAATLLINLSNFGGKEYLVIQLSKEQHNLKHAVRGLLKSRTFFSLATACIILFLPLTFTLKCWLIAYLFIKTWQFVFDALTLTQRKFQLFTSIDLVIYSGFTLILYTSRYQLNLGLFLATLILLESVRLAAALIVYRSLLTESYRSNSIFKPIQTAFPFFLLAITGFLSSRIDLYVVGTVLSKSEMNNYFIILNLVSLSQIAYASLMSTFSGSIYRFRLSTFEKFSVQTIYLSAVLSSLAGIGIYTICTFYYNIPFDHVFVLLIISNIFLFHFVMMEVYAYNRKGLQRRLPGIFLLSGLLNLLLSFLLATAFGIKGAFLSNTISALINVLLLKTRQKQLHPEPGVSFTASSYTLSRDV